MQLSTLILANRSRTVQTVTIITFSLGRVYNDERSNIQRPSALGLAISPYVILSKRLHLGIYAISHYIDAKFTMSYIVRS